MKKIILLFLLFTNALLANEYLSSIYENILLKNSTILLQDAQNIKNSIDKKNKDNIENDLKKLIISWKKVEAIYLLGELNSDFIDIPRYIDFYHHGNEDLKAQLNKIVENSDEIEIALFKNSFKSINALEYILISHNIENSRVNQIAIAIINSLINYFNDIKNAYEDKNIKNDFLKNELKTNAMLLNALIDTTYKLKEWRIGDVVGMSRKYKDEPDVKRGEYYLSKNSVIAIKSILEISKELLDKQNFKNYGDLLKSYEANEELKSSLKYINDSLQIVVTLKEEDLAQAKELYNITNRLYINYYISLIDKLQIKAKVVDADGD